MENALILIVEDEPEIAEIVQRYFEREGFRTVRAADGEAALLHHQALRPDLVVLDVKLPKLDGFGVLARLRAGHDTPVIMSTARAEDIDKLSALRIGADDYIVKPFNPLELVARARAVLKRTHGGQVRERVIRFGRLDIDPGAYSVSVRQEGDEPHALDLTLTEFRLLAHMAASPERAFSRQDLLDACLPPDGEALERTVDSHVSKLRRKLEAAGCVGIIVGVRGVGYRLSRR